MPLSVSCALPTILYGTTERRFQRWRHRGDTTARIHEGLEEVERMLDWAIPLIFESLCPAMTIQ